VPFTNADLLARVRETLAAACAGDPAPGEAYIRMLVTRGVGELTYEPAACPTPTLVIIVKPLVRPAEETFAKGIRLSLVSVRRNHPQALNPLIKSNNLLNNAMAMQEALRNGAVEALMQNHDGEIVECSQSNFFVVRGGVVTTPPLSAGLLPGITRALVLELAGTLGIPAKEGRVTAADLALVDEAFITATTREVTPVVAIDRVPVGSGAPGPITRRLLAEFRRHIAGWAAPVSKP
jgi:branched-chain amino acid aminotransferase